MDVINMDSTLYFLFSKFSSQCGGIFDYVKQLSGHLPIVPICIDDSETRNRVMKAHIKTVPAMVAASKESLDVYEGDDFEKLLHKLGTFVQQQAQAQQQAQVQAQQEAQGQSMGQTVLTPQAMSGVAEQSNMQSTPMNVNASLNARLQPQDFSSSPLPSQPMLTNQINHGQTAQIAHQQMAHQQQSLGMPPQQMQAQQMQAQQMQAQQMQSQMPPQQQMMGGQASSLQSASPSGQMIMLESQTFEKSEGYTTQELTGAVSSGNKISATSLAEKMKMERETMNPQFPQGGGQF